MTTILWWDEESQQFGWSSFDQYRKSFFLKMLVGYNYFWALCPLICSHGLNSLRKITEYACFELWTWMLHFGCHTDSKQISCKCRSKLSFLKFAKKPDLNKIDFKFSDMILANNQTVSIEHNWTQSNKNRNRIDGTRSNNCNSIVELNWISWISMEWLISE